MGLGLNSNSSFGMRVTDYDDFRIFLLDYVDQRSSKEKYSVSQFSKDLGLKDAASIAKVLRSQRYPGPKVTAKICKYFSFNAECRTYFSDLIAISRPNQEPEEWLHRSRRLASINPKRPTRQLDLTEFSVISSWHHLAIREYLKLKNSDSSVQGIRQRLKRKLTYADIERALENLIALGLVAKKDDNHYIPTTGNFKSPNNVRSEAIKKFHESSIPMGIEAMRSTSVDKRVLVGSTLAIDPSKLKQAEKLIEKFQNDLSDLLETDEATEVYQMNLQFFPLTESDGDSGILKSK